MHVLGDILVYNYNEQIKTVFLVYDCQTKSMIKNFTKSWKRNLGLLECSWNCESAFNQSVVKFSAQESTCPSQCGRHDLGRKEINHYTEGCRKECKGTHNPYKYRAEQKHSFQHMKEIRLEICQDIDQSIWLQWLDLIPGMILQRTLQIVAVTMLLCAVQTHMCGTMSSNWIRRDNERSFLLWGETHLTSHGTTARNRESEILFISFHHQPPVSHSGE